MLKKVLNNNSFKKIITDICILIRILIEKALFYQRKF